MMKIRSLVVLEERPELQLVVQPVRPLVAQPERQRTAPLGHLLVDRQDLQPVGQLGLCQILDLMHSLILLPQTEFITV
jgi:hypothetical protein